jgi:hypothetical protein
MSKLYFSVFIFLSVFLLQSCATQAVKNDEDGITVGTVQKEISVGMVASDVVTILGSPNKLGYMIKFLEILAMKTLALEPLYYLLAHLIILAHQAVLKKL